MIGVAYNPRAYPEMRLEFDGDPFNRAVLVTSRHVLRVAWNARRLRDYCRQQNVPLIILPAEDVVKRRGMEPLPLTHEETTVMLSKNPKTRKLSDHVELAVGMLYMVAMNVKTEHDSANGTRGTIHNIILDSDEPDFDPQSSIMILSVYRNPRVILFKPDETRAANLPGLPEGVFPIEPATTRYTIEMGGKSVVCVGMERHIGECTRSYYLVDAEKP